MASRAPARNAPTGGSFKMVELPMEIIHNIITLATPFPSFENNDRADFLLPLCHLHSSLARHAQRRLFTHPVLNSESAVALFADTIEDEGGVEFKSWVRTLRVFNLQNDERWHCMSRIIGACAEIREMWLWGVSEVDFANFAQLTKLHSLAIDEADYIEFDPDPDEEITEPLPMPSLINLSLSGSELGSVIQGGFLTPAVLPSLRQFHADNLPFSGGFTLTSPTTSYAAPLHHISLPGPVSLLPLLLAAPQLRSLDHWVQHRIEIPASCHFASPLIAIRLNFNWSMPMEDAVLDFLDDALVANLIDTKTVLFLPWFAESHQIADVAKYWCASRGGLRIGWKDGELETSWRGKDDLRILGHYRRFTRWVDARAVERDTVAVEEIEQEDRSVE